MIEMKEWEVRGFNVGGEKATLARGPQSSFPTAKERKVIRDGGYKIYADGILYKEPGSDNKEKGQKK